MELEQYESYDLDIEVTLKKLPPTFPGNVKRDLRALRGDQECHPVEGGFARLGLHRVQHGAHGHAGRQVPRRHHRKGINRHELDMGPFL